MYHGPWDALQTEQLGRIVNELDTIQFSIKKAAQLVREVGKQVRIWIGVASMTSVCMIVLGNVQWGVHYVMHIFMKPVRESIFIIPSKVVRYCTYLFFQSSYFGGATFIVQTTKFLLTPMFFFGVTQKRRLTSTSSSQMATDKCIMGFLFLIVGGVVAVIVVKVRESFYNPPCVLFYFALNWIRIFTRLFSKTTPLWSRMCCVKLDLHRPSDGNTDCSRSEEKKF